MNRMALLLILMLCSSCYSYHIYPKAYRRAVPADERMTAYVVNPDLQQEYRILSGSGIFHLVTDSTAPVKIRLYPLSKRYTCGQGAVLSFFTAGQVPVYFPDHYFFRFDQTTLDHTTRSLTFDLQIAQRLWFWDMFVFNKRFDQKAAMALLGSSGQPAGH